MMAAQQKRKPRGGQVKYSKTFAGILVGVWLGASIAIVQLGAATTERIVTDYHTGLAISGFDPVAYFTDGKAMVGRAEFEARYGGATWRFVNEGNREAFVAHSEAYMPGFGGHDPIGVARGVAAPGHPEVWLIASGRLYLFRNASSRNAFAASPEEYFANAQSQWPEVVRTLVQ